MGWSRPWCGGRPRLLAPACPQPLAAQWEQGQAPGLLRPQLFVGQTRGHTVSAGQGWCCSGLAVTWRRPGVPVPWLYLSSGTAVLPGGCHHLFPPVVPQGCHQTGTPAPRVWDHSCVTNPGSPSWAAPPKRGYPGLHQGTCRTPEMGDMGTNGAGTAGACGQPSAPPFVPR